MKKSKVFYFVLFTIVFLSFINFVNLMYAQEKSKDNSKETDFLADTLYTETISLEKSEEEQQIEIVIARWGTNRKKSSFKLSIESVPSFMQNVKWVEGNELSFEPDEADKPVVLSFKLKDAKKSEAQDLVLVITSSDENLVPKIRKIVLPFKGPEKDVESIIICPYDSDKEKDDDTDKICKKNIPVHAEEEYKVLVDPGISWKTPFELRILSPKKTEIHRIINVNQYLEFIGNLGEPNHLYPKIVKTDDKKHPVKLLFNIVSNLKEGIYTVQARTKIVEKDYTGFLGTTSTPSFEGEWQTVGTYKILPKKEEEKEKIEEGLVLVLDEINKESFTWPYWGYIHHKKNQLGFFGTNGWDDPDDDPTFREYWHQYSLKITHLPEKIITGEPFEIQCEARQDVIFAQAIWVEKAGGNRYMVRPCLGNGRSGWDMELEVIFGNGLFHTSRSRTSFDVACNEINSRGVSSITRDLSKGDALSKRGVLNGILS